MGGLEPSRSAPRPSLSGRGRACRGGRPSGGCLTAPGWRCTSRRSRRRASRRAWRGLLRPVALWSRPRALGRDRSSVRRCGGWRAQLVEEGVPVLGREEDCLVSWSGRHKSLEPAARTGPSCQRGFHNLDGFGPGIHPLQGDPPPGPNPWLGWQAILANKPGDSRLTILCLALLRPQKTQFILIMFNTRHHSNAA